MSGNVWNRPSGSSRVDMVISSNIMKSPSPKCYMKFWGMAIYSDILKYPILCTYMYYRIGPYYRSWSYYQILGGFHRTLQQIRLANRGRLLLRAPGPVPFGTCICSNVETIPELVMFSDFEFQTPLGTSILVQCSTIPLIWPRIYDEGPIPNYVYGAYC